MSATIKIIQTVRGGKFIDREDKTITVETTDDFLADHGDNAMRVVLSGVDGVTLRAPDVDELIENLTTVRRLLP